MDGDGKISVLDAQRTLLAYLAEMTGNDAGFTDAQRVAADIDGDGAITAADAQYILVYYLNNTVVMLPTTWDELLGKSE